MELYIQGENNVGRRGTRFWFLECPEENRIFRLPGTKPLLSGVGLFGGSQWFVLQSLLVDRVSAHCPCTQ